MIRHEFVADEVAISIQQVTADRSTLVAEYRDDDGDWQTVLPEALATPDGKGGAWVRTVPHLAIDALADWWLSRMALRLSTAAASGQSSPTGFS